MQQKRRLKPADSHSETPSLWAKILTDPWRCLGELKALVDEANEKKASVLIEPLRLEYPELYAWAESLVDLPPAEVRLMLIQQWPLLGMAGLKLSLDYQLRLIQMLQNQIRLRREGEHEKRVNKNIQRQIGPRS